MIASRIEKRKSLQWGTANAQVVTELEAHVAMLQEQLKQLEEQRKKEVSSLKREIWSLKQQHSRPQSTVISRSFSTSTIRKPMDVSDEMFKMDDDIEWQQMLQSSEQELQELRKQVQESEQDMLKLRNERQQLEEKFVLQQERYNAEIQQLKDKLDTETQNKKALKEQISLLKPHSSLQLTKWMPDFASTNCTACSKPFSFWIRKVQKVFETSLLIVLI